MRYLTGSCRHSQAASLAALGVGLMLTPRTRYRPARVAGFPAWAADNGCFAQGASFDLARFYAWLARMPRAGLLFATAPDVLGDPHATLARARPVLADLRARGVPAAFVAQDGATRADIPWAECDGLFLGGRATWKLSRPARELVREARARGLWTHMGRVNSERRVRYAALIGCDSADGNFLKFRNRGDGDGVRDLARWFRQMLLALA